MQQDLLIRYFFVVLRNNLSINLDPILTMKNISKFWVILESDVFDRSIDGWKKERKSMIQHNFTSEMWRYKIANIMQQNKNIGSS